MSSLYLGCTLCEVDAEGNVLLTDSMARALGLPRPKSRCFCPRMSATSAWSADARSHLQEIRTRTERWRIADEDAGRDGQPASRADAALVRYRRSRSAQRTWADAAAVMRHLGRIESVALIVGAGDRFEIWNLQLAVTHTEGRFRELANWAGRAPPFTPRRLAPRAPGPPLMGALRCRLLGHAAMTTHHRSGGSEYSHYASVAATVTCSARSGAEEWEEVPAGHKVVWHRRDQSGSAAASGRAHDPAPAPRRHRPRNQAPVETRGQRRRPHRTGVTMLLGLTGRFVMASLFDHLRRPARPVPPPMRLLRRRGGLQLFLDRGADRVGAGSRREPLHLHARPVDEELGEVPLDPFEPITPGAARFSASNSGAALASIDVDLGIDRESRHHR